MGNQLMNHCCTGGSCSGDKSIDPFYKKELTEPLSEIEYAPNAIASLSMVPIKGNNVIRRVTGSPYNYYDIIGLLGAGAYGKVFKIRHKTSNQIRAMKIISKAQMNTKYTFEEIENEIEILKKVSHPNIIKLFEFYSDEDDYYLISEFISDGDLCKHVEKFGKIPELLVKKIMFDVFNAVSYLHMNDIVHGDLKLENVMVDNNVDLVSKPKRNKICENNNITNNDSNNKEKELSNDLNSKLTNNENSNTTNETNINPNINQEDINSFDNINLGDSLKIDNVLGKSRKCSFEEKVKNDIDLFKVNKSSENSEIDILENYEHFEMKLIDFGCSKFFSKKKKELKGEIGTLYYLAPEVLKNKYNKACDIWSCGVLMYILLAGEIPFKGLTSIEIKEKILAGRFCFYKRKFENISFEAKDLIKRCFIYDPKLRISAKEALNHPFFKNNFSLSEKMSNNTQTLKVLSSIVQCKRKSKFFQAVLTYLTHNFVKKKELTYLNNIFILIDTDMDGKLSKAELSTALKKLNIEVSELELRQIMHRIDFDNDGFIDYREFLQATIDMRNLFTEENLKSAFEIFDTKSDGTVSVLELEEILGLIDDKLNENIKNEFLKEINKSEDDVYTFEEFRDIIMGFVQEEFADNISENSNSEVLKKSSIYKSDKENEFILQSD